MADLMRIYHKMYENPVFFKLNCFLLRTGVEKELAYCLKTRRKEKKSKVDEKTKDFFETNSDAVNNNIGLFADKKSCDIYKAVIDYRIQKKPLRRDIYSLNDQYFAKDFFSLDDQEVFIDCGAFVGDTINNLFREARRKKKRIKKIVAFEPEHENCVLLRKYFSNDARIVCVEAGVSDCDKEMKLVGSSTYAKITHGDEENGKVVKLRSIDKTEECFDATYIKMDIEGAEMEALKGAVETIKRNKPKLAICIYHGNEDMINIIPFIHQLNPSYKLFIRHHSRDASETVLYAIP